jgi:ferredoxin
MSIAVWIEDGCISCGACVDVAPEVFAMDAGDGCVVCGSARLDGRDTDNRAEKSPLKPEVAETCAEQIRDAIQGCPTEVIKQLSDQHQQA